MDVPPLGPNTPRKGNALSRAFGRALLGALRFGFEGTFPDVRRGVLVVAPHTSNWDFQVGMGARWALGLDAHWMGKHTIFQPAPLGAFWRATGGIAVDRSSPEKALAAVKALYDRPEGLIIAIAPEGTRYAVERWKSGYHRIARAAGVPVLPVAFDWKARVVRLHPAFETSEDYAADTAALMALFTRDMAYRPDNFWS
jgi:1-acyl-sn-glycerol-3-phosphate acyltransferase